MNILIKYDEATLIKLLQNGDDKGFNYLYENYNKALFAEIKNIVSDPDIAADVLQEVFINIYKKISTYDQDKGHLFTWIMAIARNQAIDTVLSKGYRNQQQNKELSSIMDQSSHTTTTKVDNIGLLGHLKKINARYWDVLYLKYFQGHTHEEIASMLKMPLGTVKTRVKTGLSQLRKLMAR